MHLFLIPQITVTGLLAILVGGLLFTAAYMCTRRLWFSSSLHATLDFTQDAIFGVGTYHLSGVAAVGLLSAQLSGPAALTGGAVRDRRVGADAGAPARSGCLSAGVGRAAWTAGGASLETWSAPTA